MLIFGSASVEFRKKLNVCMFTENDKQNLSPEIDLPILPCSSWLPGRDSNPDKQNQNLSCYRYTTGQKCGAL